MGLSFLQLPFELALRVAFSPVWLFHILRIFMPLVLKTVVLGFLHWLFGARLAGGRTGAMICLGDAVRVGPSAAIAHLVDFRVILHMFVRMIYLPLKFLIGLEFVVLFGRDPRQLIGARSSFGVVVRFLGPDLV